MEVDQQKITPSEDPDGTTKSPIHSLVERMKEAIWHRRPILGDIMKKHGGTTLHTYSKDFFDVNHAPKAHGRRDELISTAQELLSKRLGPDVAEKVGRQLKKTPLVSTADHHGPIDHPFWVNANIISAIPYLENGDPDLQYLVVFSFASVSVNNASAYPRGVLFHGGKNGTGNLIRLPILPDKLKMGVVYGMRPFTREDLTKAESELLKKEKAGEIVEGRADKIRALMEAYFGRDDVLSASDLASQISIANYHFWPTLFLPEGKTALSEAPQVPERKIPNLIYLEIETLVTELLLRFHLTDPSSLIYRLLFDERMQELSLQHFNNVPGMFSFEKKWGSHMFWGIDEKLHRVKMDLVGNQLRSEGGEFVFDLNAETITQALRDKKIFPSMGLCYLLVSLYYGMKCLGGFCQVNDLTMTKEAWGKLLHEVGETEEAEALAPIQTKELGGDGMVLAYLKTVHDDLVPATGIDMALEEADTRFENYVDLSKHVTLSDMMTPMLPEMYTVLYAAPDRHPDFTSVTPEQIMEHLGIKKKLAELLQ